MRRRDAAAVGIVVGLGAVLLGSAQQARADYGTTPALQLPWRAGQWRNVSGFTYGYANPLCNGIPTKHTGIDAYAIDFGLNFEEVDAAAYGTVGAEGSTSAGGYYIWIQHPNNIQTYYGHLSAFSVGQGATVYKGQRIGTSGNSGPPGTGAHIHFRVSTGGTAPFNGTAYKPEPMSGVGPPGYIGWDRYGCSLDTTTTFDSTRPSQQGPVDTQQFASPFGVLVRGGDAQAWFGTTDSTGHITGWTPLGGTFAGPPVGTLSLDGSRFDAYAIGLDAKVWHDARNSTGWSGWSELTYNQPSGPSETEGLSADRRPDGTADLFIRDANGAAWHAATDVTGSTFQPWEPLSGNFKGTPQGTWNSSLQTFDLYGIGLNDQIWHNTTQWGSSWSGWTLAPLGQTSAQAETENVTSARRWDGSADLFLRGPNGDAQHAPTDASGNPTFWQSLGGSIKGAPYGQWISTTVLDVYAIGLNDAVYQDTWNGSSWSGWVQQSGIAA